ncbi:MAG: RNA 2',3'-cyclic phosphodiesterase [Fimbriimonadaceae bacterium]
MGSIRAFVAIYPSPDELKRCVAFRDRLRELWSDARWVRDDQIHLTLRFIEALDESSIVDLVARLRHGAEHSFPFLLGLSHRVPPWPGARVVALSTRSDELDRLARVVESACRNAGLPPEERPFRGHVTLARHDGRWPIRELPSFSDSWLVRSIRLVRSELGRGGARHTVLGEFRLER